MDRKVLGKDFYEAFLNTDYYKATKILGQMEAYGFTNGRYRYFEMLVLYEQKEYNKICSRLEHQKLTWQEKELYLASLAKLKRLDDLKHNLKRAPQISHYCYYYICYLLGKNGYALEESYETIVEDETYFQDLYKWCIFFDLAEVYTINKEKMMMINSDGDKEHIKTLHDTQNQILRNIRIKDVYVDKIIDCVRNNKEFAHEIVLALPGLYLGKPNSNDISISTKFFYKVRDVINYLDIMHQVNPQSAAFEVILYKDELLLAVEQNNQAAINLLSNIYLETHYQNKNVIDNNGTSFVSVFKSIIQRHSPEFIPFIESHEVDAEIRALLTPKGIIAYRAAVWQYDNVSMSKYGTLDAGMLCLSYMRILELELNERIVKPLAQYKSYFVEIYENEKEEESRKCEQKGSTSKEITKIKNKYDKEWGGLKKLDTGLELGPLYFLLLNFKEGRNKYLNIVAPILEIIKKEVLTEKGIEALKSGEIADWINNEIRETYRNPPAHTRYVGIQKALECRSYVLEKLKKLAPMIKNNIG